MNVWIGWWIRTLTFTATERGQIFFWLLVLVAIALSSFDIQNKWYDCWQLEQGLPGPFAFLYLGNFTPSHGTSRFWQVVHWSIINSPSRSSITIFLRKYLMSFWEKERGTPREMNSAYEQMNVPRSSKFSCFEIFLGYLKITSSGMFLVLLLCSQKKFLSNSILSSSWPPKLS